MKEYKLPPANETVRNLKDMQGLVMMPEGYTIYEWHEQEDGKGKPSQVHLMMELPNKAGMFVIRFKGPIEITRMIEGLTRHRDSVWPKQS